MSGNSIRITHKGALLTIGLAAGLSLAAPFTTMPSASAQPVPSSARAGERPCSEAKKLRSVHAKEPTKITFVNKSGMYRSLNWIDYKGQQQSYGGLNPGETKTLSTFRTHPWVSATGPGDCLKVYLPAAEPSTVVLK